MDKIQEVNSPIKDFDVIILTAANELQAEGYRRELEWRRRVGILGEATELLVVSDLGGRRIGSFYATLNVLRQVSSYIEDGAKILICHSGGDSRRTPAYATVGKVFTPVPCRSENGEPLALFDLILRNCSQLPIDSGVLIASGDVVPTFDAEDLAGMDFSRGDITGVAYYDSVERGSRHGVYIPEDLTLISSCQKVKGFLQKPDRATASDNDAINPDGCVAVDTGLVALSKVASLALVELASKQFLEKVAAGHCHQMDLYEEFLMAALPGVDEATYISRFAERSRSEGYLAALHEVYSKVHGMEFKVNVASKCDFFHIGSSVELLSSFTGDNLLALRYGFAKGRRVDDKIKGDECFAFNSPNVAIEANGQTLVENVSYEGVLVLPGQNIVTGLPKCDISSISLPLGIGLVVLPMGEGKWAAVAYGIKDDFKTPFPSVSKPCLFLNRPIEEWMVANDIAPGSLWQSDERDGLWTARLWKIGAIEEVIEDAVAIAGGLVDAQPIEFNKGSKVRYSMSKLCAYRG